MTDIKTMLLGNQRPRCFDFLSALTSAYGEGTHYAHFRLPRHGLSDRLAFGASTDGFGRDGDHCNTRWNAIVVSADSRRGFTKPPGLTAPPSSASRRRLVAPAHSRNRGKRARPLYSLITSTCSSEGSVSSSSLLRSESNRGGNSSVASA